MFYNAKNGEIKVGDTTANYISFGLELSTPVLMR